MPPLDFNLTIKISYLSAASQLESLQAAQVALGGGDGPEKARQKKDEANRPALLNKAEPPGLARAPLTR